MYLLNVLAKKNFILGSINKKLLSRQQFAVEGVGVRGVLKKFLWRNLLLDNFELVPKSWQKISADVKADVRHQEIKKTGR